MHTEWTARTREMRLWSFPAEYFKMFCTMCRWVALLFLQCTRMRLWMLLAYDGLDSNIQLWNTLLLEIDNNKFMLRDIAIDTAQNRFAMNLKQMSNERSYHNVNYSRFSSHLKLTTDLLAFSLAFVVMLPFASIGSQATKTLLSLINCDWFACASMCLFSLPGLCCCYYCGAVVVVVVVCSNDLFVSRLAERSKQVPIDSMLLLW